MQPHPSSPPPCYVKLIETNRKDCENFPMRATITQRLERGQIIWQRGRRMETAAIITVIISPARGIYTNSRLLPTC